MRQPWRLPCGFGFRLWKRQKTCHQCDLGRGENYAAWLSKLTGKDYRLLTEAELEYAALAGTTTAYSFGEELAGVCEYGNFADISLRNEAHGNGITA